MEYDAASMPDADPEAVAGQAAALGARAIRVLDDRAIGGDAHLRCAADDPRRLEDLPGVVADRPRGSARAREQGGDRQIDRDPTGIFWG